jgi:hypothetical protein
LHALHQNRFKPGSCNSFQGGLLPRFTCQVLVTGRHESDAAFTPVQKRHAEFVFRVSNLPAGCAPLSISLAAGNLAQCM